MNTLCDTPRSKAYLFNILMFDFSVYLFYSRFVRHSYLQSGFLVGFEKWGAIVCGVLFLIMSIKLLATRKQFSSVDRRGELLKAFIESIIFFIVFIAIYLFLSGNIDWDAVDD